ncbi:SIR2 family protein [Ruania alba]|uniref:SIR2-like domain-containing protein n=1 Tax=Ruania alba TaxID=648782 RepID=A0A1H5GZB7_9MICO|nr:SIR2-like domain-containing protein [Ruania alba]
MKWPDELVGDIARRRAVLYLGAGVSASAASEDDRRPPQWEEFLLRARRRLGKRVPSDTVKQLIDLGDLLGACELLKASLDESWPELLKQEFVAPKFRPSRLHRRLHELDLPIVLTPNFDAVYDNFVSAETNGTTVVKQYYDADLPLFLRRSYRFVLKMHGSVSEPSRMVFTRSEYARLRSEHARFMELMGSLILTHTFLFVGTSLNDPDLRLFLENYHHSHPNSPPHYMTSPRSEVSPHLDDSIRKNMNLKLLRYSPENEHSDLVESISDLILRVESERRVIADSESW